MRILPIVLCLVALYLGWCTLSTAVSAVADGAVAIIAALSAVSRGMEGALLGTRQLARHVSTMAPPAPLNEHMSSASTPSDTPMKALLSIPPRLLKNPMLQRGAFLRDMWPVTVPAIVAMPVAALSLFAKLLPPFAYLLQWLCGNLR